MCVYMLNLFMRCVVKCQLMMRVNTITMVDDISSILKHETIHQKSILQLINNFCLEK